MSFRENKYLKFAKYEPLIFNGLCLLSVIILGVVIFEIFYLMSFVRDTNTHADDLLVYMRNNTMPNFDNLTVNINKTIPHFNDLAVHINNTTLPLVEHVLPYISDITKQINMSIPHVDDLVLQITKSLPIYSNFVEDLNATAIQNDITSIAEQLKNLTNLANKIAHYLLPHV